MTLSWGLLKPDTLALICADLAEAEAEGWAKGRDMTAHFEARDALEALVGQDEADRMIEEAGER